MRTPQGNYAPPDAFMTNRGTMTHKDRIAASVNKAATMGDRKLTGYNNWGQRHAAAWNEPQPIEEPFVKLILAAAIYADSHKSRFESGIGEDGFLGPAWSGILRHIRTLLNGELGRLDAGTLDALICDMLTAEGFNVDE